MFLSHKNTEFTNRSFVNYIRVILISLLAIFINSCTPDDTINPANYEIYISLSSDQTPAISPDGEWIAYFHKNLESSEDLNYPTGLYIMSINGNNRRLLIKGIHFQPSWSPDGEWLVFSNNGKLKMINILNDSIRIYPELSNIPLFYPDWSKDGGLILFSSPYVDGGGAFVCTPDFKTAKQIYNHYDLSAYPIKWYSLTQFIGCVFSSDWAHEEIFIIDTTLTTSKRLTFNNSSDRGPAVFPNNKSIVWSRDVQIFRMDSNGTNHKRLDYHRILLLL